MIAIRLCALEGELPKRTAVMTKPVVLAACPSFAFPTLHKAFGAYTDLVHVTSLDMAKTVLRSNSRVALIVCGVYFDESRMYDPLTYAHREFVAIPFVCVRVSDAEIPRISQEALKIAAESLGAAAYIDVPSCASELGVDAAERELRNVVLGHLPTKRPESAV